RLQKRLKQQPAEARLQQHKQIADNAACTAVGIWSKLAPCLGSQLAITVGMRAFFIVDCGFRI
ncbi:MAG: hypothetical protein ABIQ44_08095, partial [Chloroflexia bacterium]